MKSPQKKTEVSNILDRFVGADKAGEYMRLIEQMLDERQYQFASDTLRGIYESIETNGYITEGQMRAVENINNSAYER